MKSFIIFIGSVLFFSMTSFAQPGQVHGQIIDVTSGEPLVGASIYLQNTEKGAATIADGKYLITKIKPGMYNIVSSYMGYRNVVVEDVKISSSKKVQLDIALPRNADFIMPAKLEEFYLKKLSDEVRNKLDEIRKINKAEYYRTLQSIYFKILINNQSDSKSSLNNQIINLEVSKDLYAVKYKMQKGSDKKDTKAKLKDILTRLFLLKSEKREKEIESARNQLNNLIDDIQKNKMEAGRKIEKELNKLLNE